MRSGKKRVTCDQCDGKCCRYVALEIDAPTSKREYDYIRWYLLHRNVYVFVDHDGGWFVEFETDCDQLANDHSCRIYESRPRICRDHGDVDGICEHHAGTDPYGQRFATAAEFEAYLECRGVDWEWKRRADR